MQYHNVLLIDDDEDDQEIFVSAVKQVASSVVCNCFDNATEALQNLAAGVLVPDVIFLDLNMPGMNGQQFLVEIKKRSDLSNIPVIIFSTASQSNTIQLMKSLGAHEFITKPSDYDKLLNILRPLLANDL
jgi:CheY-like chemotaxis protein